MKLKCPIYEWGISRGSLFYELNCNAESMSLDLPDRGLKLMDAGFDVLDGGGYLLLEGTGVGAYVMEVSACVPVDEWAIALASEDGDGDGVLLAIDEE